MSGVRFERLGFAYRPGAWVLRGCTGAIAAGGVLAVLGPNGRGKTTLLRLLLRVLKPVEGQVAIDGATAFVPQIFDVAFAYSVLDMVLMGRARRLGLLAQPGRADIAAAHAALDRLGIGDLAARPFQSLSGGQRQLVILARALAAEARVLLLDEPVSALDLRNQVVVLGWLRSLARTHGITIVFTTHHPQHAAEIADRVLLMRATNAFDFGPPATTMSEANLAALYGVAVRRIPFEADGLTRHAFVAVLAQPPD